MNVMTSTHDVTVRMRLAEKTVRMRFVELPTTALPKAISAFDGKTVRMRALDVPVVGKVANTVRQRYLDLSKLAVRPPTKWELARVALILLLASMPILAIGLRQPPGRAALLSLPSGAQSSRRCCENAGITSIAIPRIPRR